MFVYFISNAMTVREFTEHLYVPTVFLQNLLRTIWSADSNVKKTEYAAEEIKIRNLTD